MPHFTEIAYAKINLALHVRRRRDDGYHELETLFAFADQGDVLVGELADELTFEITGPFASSLRPDDENLVMRAARALQRDGQGAKLRLEKNLPIASGIGGGSADAAATLRLLAKLWDVQADLLPIAATLGADVPACVLSETVFGTGVGDELQRWMDPDVVGAPLMLVNPGVSCTTGPVFNAWDGVDRGPLDPARWRDSRNDLEVPAIGAVPQIGNVLGALRQQSGVTLARMSGSGATCFALFESKACRDAAHAMISEMHPDWWLMASNLR
jgi:4-diphosphocytidyl-2-C-methyl-D-erythritol kinase